MTSSGQTPTQQLLQALFESSLVKAAAIVTHGGEVLDRIGQAKVFDLRARPQAGKKPTENVYLVELLTQEMLLVVFEDHVEFERLRKSVDTLIAHHELERPAKESKEAF